MRAARQPFEVNGARQSFEFGNDIGVAHQLGRSGFQIQQVLQQAIEAACQRSGFLFAFSARAIAFTYLEEGAVVVALFGDLEYCERILPNCDVGRKIKSARFAVCPLAQPGNQRSLFGGERSILFRERSFDLAHRQRRQAHVHAARADGGNQLARIGSQQEKIRELGWFLQNFE